MLQPFKKLGLLSTLITGGLVPAFAQLPYLVPSTATEFVHVNPVVARPASTSAYSLSSALVNTSYGPLDMYLSGWNTPVNGATSEFLCKFTTPGSPSSIVFQDAFTYHDVADLEVGAIYNDATGRLNLLVAYYQLGIGHFLDIYDLENFPTTQITLTSSIQLSNSTQYGRIRMDFHRTDIGVVTWAYPGVGIQAIAGQNGNWSNVTTLDATAAEQGPDVALSHSGDIYANFVYYNNTSGTITKSLVDVNSLLASPGTITPAIEDVNFTSPNLWDFRAVIDCPDHYDVKNWAYTYADQSSNIWVRYIDHHGAATYNTVSVNSGILGNLPTAGLYEAYAPTLHYGTGAIGGETGQIMVGWYTTDGNNLNGYIALEMKEDGAGLISDPDYLALPNAFTSSYYPYSGIAFSKGGDDGIVPPFLFTTYYDYNNTTNFYQLHYAFHKWSNTAFKGVKAPECNGSQPHPALAVATNIDIYPNPFRDAITASVSLTEAGLLQLDLTDITGRQVWQQEAALKKGTHRLQADKLESLPGGIYIFKAALNGKKIASQKIIKQQSGK